MSRPEWRLVINFHSDIELFRLPRSPYFLILRTMRRVMLSSPVGKPTPLSTSAAGPTSTPSSRAGQRSKNQATRAATGGETTPSTPLSSETTAVDARTPRSSNLKCWNCDGVGHLSRNCAASPRLHCYRCGRAEVTLRTCPDCSGKE